LSLSNLESFLKSVAKDDRLREFQAPVRDQLEAVSLSFRDFFQSSIPLVRGLSDHLLGVTGKQFRPSLVLLVARSGQPRAEDAVFAATVIELIHTATLVHDDTIDKSMVRRGLPTINAMYNDMVATILGDYIYTKAFHELLERGMSELVPVVARTTYRMSIGEMLQIQQKSDLDLTEEAYFQLVDEKTASLMSASTEIGALVGRLGPERTARFRAFGEALGRAYQVTDDLFDYLGDPGEIGKGVRTDLPEGKVTLPLIRALAEAGPRDRAVLRELAARRSNLEEADWRQLLDLLEKTGAIAYCRDKAKNLAGESIALAHAEPDSPWRDSLEKAVAYAVQRIH
jgi:octaprenyl-diphosphate synthase